MKPAPLAVAALALLPLSGCVVKVGATHFHEYDEDQPSSHHFDIRNSRGSPVAIEVETIGRDGATHSLRSAEIAPRGRFTQTIRKSSDLSRIRLSVTDVASGQTREWTFPGADSIVDFHADAAALLRD